MGSVGLEFSGLPEVGWPGFGRCQHTAGWHATICPYFFVYSVRRVRANLRAGSGCPGVSSVAGPVRSQVFKRLWPPGPVAILGLTGLAVNDRRVGWVHLWLADDRNLLCTGA